MKVFIFVLVLFTAEESNIPNTYNSQRECSTALRRELKAAPEKKGDCYRIEVRIDAKGKK